MWIETLQQRKQQNRTYSQGAQQVCCCALASLHYETMLDSGTFDCEIDTTPLRVDNAQLDGWRITQNGWHYALGQPGDKSTDGWIGFGGRQGTHWLKFRLARVGYLHWPTRDWQDVGGAPNYDRAYLEYETHALTLGPNDDQINVESVTNWRSLWTTPGGGELSALWKARGEGLKEEIIINQAAREWITANRPPTTPLDETWFGFVFQVDWSDVPRIVRDAIEQSPDSDFTDDDAGIELRDALDQTLAFLPLSQMYAGKGKAQQSATLRKRFWRGDDGNHYLLIGVRCDVLATLPSGDLVFDPTVTPQVADDDDNVCASHNGAGVLSTEYNLWMGYDGSDYNSVGLRFQLNVPAATTITAAKITFTASESQSGDTVKLGITYQDANDPADFSGDDYAAFIARTRSAAKVDWDFTTNWTQNNTYDTDSIVSVIQALVDEAYWAANEHCVLFCDEDGSDSGAYRIAYSFTNSAAKSAVLTVEYSVARMPRPPAAYNNLAIY